MVSEAPQSYPLTSFPGPAQLSVTCSTVLEAMESWVGPGNEATYPSHEMLDTRPLYSLKPYGHGHCKLSYDMLYSVCLNDL